MEKEKKRITDDAVEILHRLYYEGNPERLASLEEERVKLDIAQQVYDLRTEARLTQKQLAERLGVSEEVICDPEDTEYVGKQSVAQKFVEFLSNDRNLRLVEITVDIAKQAGYLRGKYPALRTLDALQISASIAVNADAFLTNDHRLRSIQEIPIIILSDYTP